MTNKEQQVEMHKHRLKNCIKEIFGSERVKSILPKESKKTKSDKLPDEKLISVLRLIDHKINETIEPILEKIIDRSNGVVGLEDLIKTVPIYSDRTFFTEYMLDNPPSSQILGVAIKTTWDILQFKSEVDSKLCSVFLNSNYLNILNDVNSNGKIVFDLQNTRVRILDALHSLCFLINEREKKSRIPKAKNVANEIENIFKESLKTINKIIEDNENFHDSMSMVGENRNIALKFLKERYKKRFTVEQLQSLTKDQKYEVRKHLMSVLPNSSQKKQRIKEVFKKPKKSKNRDDNNIFRISKNNSE